MKTAITHIKKVDLPARTLAYVRNVGPYRGDTELFGRLFAIVSTWAGSKGFLADPKTEAITVYHDHPESVPPSEQRISVGFTVPKGTNSEGDIQIMEIPSGQFVVGSFEILPEDYGSAWGEVMEYMDTEQLLPRATITYESYKNEPHEHPEGKHIVDICVGLNV